MAAVFMGMIVSAGAGVGVAATLVRHAQRHWVARPAAVEA
ncbi:hypothetical protein EV188_105225 [Actinomycetospora succinea]|uniref:Uncharacterized protein n=1 Tax=Actinomycetospora succinea TaxID=663603 RepID=A0A4R6VFC7_9PSEU|nr:hypothetical protein EV188_105225 [Actinomycetospora succinea]